VGLVRLDPELLQRWTRTAGRWGAHPAAVQAAGSAVLHRYGEPGRHYHTAEHVAEVLAALDRLVGLDAPGGDAAPGVAIDFAAWFHDVVHDARAVPGANEHASAGYACCVLADLGAPEPVVTETARLIRLTAEHAPDPRDVHGCVLTDADLSILGAPEGRYRRYAADVRAEYSFVADVDWRRGRSAVLEALARRPRIFLTDPARDIFEDRARRNLARELASLRR